MVDPSRLVASATRLYGADMERLWGEMRPAAAPRVPDSPRRRADQPSPGTPWSRIHAGPCTRTASAYFDRGSAHRVRGGHRRHKARPGQLYSASGTPRPTSIVEAWRQSADLILAWDPDTLFLTHFGPFHGRAPHFQGLFRADPVVEQSSSDLLLQDPALTDDERQERFVEEAVQELRRRVGETEAGHYSRAGRLDYSWRGLARYWRKKGLWAEGCIHEDHGIDEARWDSRPRSPIRALSARKVRSTRLGAGWRRPADACAQRARHRQRTDRLARRSSTAESERWYLEGQPITYWGSVYYPAGAAVFFNPCEDGSQRDY